MQSSDFETPVEMHRVATPSGILPARVIRPADRSGLPPLVVLHGISRNAGELVDHFRPEAARSGRVIVVPQFSQARWPHFQRPCRAARPDQAVLALLAHLALTDSGFAGPVDIFGHSGGAQLAHRFAMLYPQRVGRLSLAAAGWYCLPDDSMAYPYGLGADDTADSHVWARRHAQALPAYLRLEVEVLIGTQDTTRDATLRQTLTLDRVQGRDRLARAETYVDRFRAAARAQGIAPDITLTRLPGVSHDVVQAIRLGGLARLVTAGAVPTLAVAS